MAPPWKAGTSLTRPHGNSCAPPMCILCTTAPCASQKEASSYVVTTVGLSRLAIARVSPRWSPWPCESSTASIFASLSSPMSAAGFPVRNGSMMTRRPAASMVKQAWPCQVRVNMRRPYSVVRRPYGSRSTGDGKRSLSYVLLVRGGIHQLAELRRVLCPQLDHPARSVGVAVHGRGILLQPGVRLDDSSRDRAKQLGDRLHRFDRAEHLHLREHGARLRQLHKYNIAEFPLGVVRDADHHHAGVVRLFDVLVLGGVAQVVGDVGHGGDRSRPG